MAEFQSAGVRVVGISTDGIASHSRFRRKHGFTFPLLSDPEHRVLEAYGAWGKKKRGGEVAYGALRTTVVVGADGRLERIYRKVKAKGHAQAVLDDLNR